MKRLGLLRVYNLLLSLLIVLLSYLFASTLHAGPVPDTGQTKCYDNDKEILCPQPSEPFYGQDGNYIINPPSFTKLDENGDPLPDTATSWSMVMDNNTNLIWEVREVYSKPAWQKWSTYLSDLNSQEYGGYSDWRIPTIAELSYILKRGNTDFYYYFIHPISPQYWSTTAHQGNSNMAWSAYFSNYGVTYSSTEKIEGHYVKAVRGGNHIPYIRYIDNGDGTVTDTYTALTWQKGEVDPMVWKDALAYCESLNLAGHTDWRLPNENELLSLVNYQYYDPAIDTYFFPDTVTNDEYWSSTTYELEFFAFTVDFDIGGDSPLPKLDPHHVRAVRYAAWAKAYNTLFYLKSTHLEMMREYRDEVLCRTATGRKYKNLLYRNSKTALKVLLDNPELMYQANELIATNKNAVSEVLNGEEGVIYNTDEIVAFLDAYAKKSPIGLKILAYMVKKDMQRKQKQGKLFFGFRLE